MELMVIDIGYPLGTEFVIRDKHRIYWMTKDLKVFTQKQHDYNPTAYPRESWTYKTKEEAEEVIRLYLATGQNLNIDTSGLKALEKINNSIKKKCSCNWNDVLNFGCKCGGI